MALKKEQQYKPGKRRRNVFVTLFLIVFIGGIILLGSIFIFNSILKNVFGQYALSDNLLSVEGLTKSFDRPKINIGVLYSERTQKMLKEGSTWQQDNIFMWERMLKGNKFTYTIIGDEDLDQGKHFDYDLIVLPGTKSISDAGILNIKKYIERGGSVFATGSVAAYAEGGKWRGWDLLNEVFGVQFTEDLKDENLFKLNTLRGGYPVTANVPTGYTLEIATWDNPLATEVLEPRTTQLSFWYDFRREDGLVWEEVKKSAGIIYGKYGEGKFVWFGFDLTSVTLTSGEDYEILDQLLKNAVFWLTDRPVATLRDWPGDYRAAAVIVPVLNEEIGNINNVLPYFEQYDVEPTFFIESGKAEKYADLLKKLKNYGNFGAVIDIGYLESVNDTANRLNNFEVQTDQMRRAKVNIENISGGRVIGMNPFYGLFDDNTLSAMAQSGYKFVITDSLTDRSVPKYVVKNEESLLSITKTARDDKEIIGNYGLVDTSFQFYTYQEDIDRLLFEGGLYVFKIHTNYQCRSEYAGVVREVLEYLKSQNIWVTSLPELYDWWSTRSRIEMRIENRGTNRVVVTLTNIGESELKAFTIPVGFQQQVSDFYITTEIIGTPLPEAKYDSTSKVLYLDIKNFEPDDSRIYYIDYAVKNNKKKPDA